MTLPGKGTGQWRYAISGHGHAEEGFIGISSERPSSPDGKLLTLAILPLALIAWRVKKR
jgi:hypothetical protein